MRKLIKRVDVYMNEDQLWDVIREFILDSTTTIPGAIADATKEKTLLAVAEKVGKEMWDEVSDIFGVFMTVVNFTGEYHKSLEIRNVLEAFEQIDEYGGRGAVRFRSSIYKTGSGDRDVDFSN